MMCIRCKHYVYTNQSYIDQLKDMVIFKDGQFCTIGKQQFFNDTIKAICSREIGCSHFQEKPIFQTKNNRDKD